MMYCSWVAVGHCSRSFYRSLWRFGRDSSFIGVELSSECSEYSNGGFSEGYSSGGYSSGGFSSGGEFSEKAGLWKSSSPVADKVEELLSSCTSHPSASIWERL